eukprot:TRINITY_DN14866_c0_g3_i1.p1 TRINITY_DN14866_c0_g3~~TRINITY_DN14866_c0_g3_i1.p1  ORF type:complete len:127 (-),score=42.06 TRINITY_DN14866_c0_g3_i1:17-397(-)
MSTGAWVALCGIAVVTKLSSSVDDIAWMLPYMKTLEWPVNAGLYVLLMECVVGVAVALSYGGREAVQSVLSDDGYWNSERVLSLVSGVLLTGYAIYLFYDWYTEEEEVVEEAVSYTHLTLPTKRIV